MSVCVHVNECVFTYKCVCSCVNVCSHVSVYVFTYECVFVCELCVHV